jgi:hypothetical protein
MDERIKSELEQEIPTSLHKALLSKCKGLVQMSRSHMSTYYPDWDRQDLAFQNEVAQPDSDDQKASERKEPSKLVVPVTSSQVSTFIAYCFALYYQRDSLYELTGRGAEDELPAKIGESLIERDLQYNKFPLVLHQFLLDVGRFGLGIIKTGWIRKTQRVRKQEQVGGFSIGGLQLIKPMMQDVEVDEVKYLGNEITNVSPYRFFPDTRLPLTRFQEGEFCACEDEISYVTLKQMEHDGEVAGIKYLKGMSTTQLKDRGNGDRFTELRRDDTQGDIQALTIPSDSPGTYVHTQCQVTLIPNEFKMSDGTTMGEEDFPVKYNVWYVNDQRVIKCEPLGYIHGMYTFDLSQYTPDLHRLVNQGLAGSIEQMQSIISWLINSHITSVRKTIQNWLVVDPAGVKMEDLHKRSPVIRLKEEAARLGIDRVIKQLEVRDVTANHIGDAKVLHDMVQVATGINDNALGQFNTGRRSATEAKNVNAATAARLKVVATIIWYAAMMPLAEKLLSNLRDGLDEETYVRVIGDTADPEQLAEFKKVTKNDIVGDYDFEIFDGTLPTERVMHAQALSELLQVLLTNPSAVLTLGYDPRLIMQEILELRGIRNPKRFMLPGNNPLLQNNPALAQLLNDPRAAAMLPELVQRGVINAGVNVPNGQAGVVPPNAAVPGAPGVQALPGNSGR